MGILLGAWTFWINSLVFFHSQKLVKQKAPGRSWLTEMPQKVSDHLNQPLISKLLWVSKERHFLSQGFYSSKLRRLCFSKLTVSPQGCEICSWKVSWFSFGIARYPHYRTLKNFFMSFWWWLVTQQFLPHTHFCFLPLRIRFPPQSSGGHFEDHFSPLLFKQVQTHPSMGGSLGILRSLKRKNDPPGGTTRAGMELDGIFWNPGS